MNKPRVLLENPYDASPCGNANIPETNEQRVAIVENLTSEIEQGILKVSESVHSRLIPLGAHINRFGCTSPELDIAFKKLNQACIEFGIWPKI